MPKDGKRLIKFIFGGIVPIILSHKTYVDHLVKIHTMSLSFHHLICIINLIKIKKINNN
jgi:hypothetical protein